MGFNKKILPQLEALEKIRESYANDAEFLRIFLYNPDALIGSQESLNYLKKIDNEHRAIAGGTERSGV